MLARTLDFLKIWGKAVQPLVFGFFLQHFGVAENGVHRSPQLVAHIRQKLRFYPAGRFRRFFCRNQILLRLLTLDAEGNAVRNRSQGLKRCVRQGLAGEHRHDAKQPSVHNQWVAGKRDHPFALRPFFVADTRVIPNGVRQVGQTL